MAPPVDPVKVALSVGNILTAAPLNAPAVATAVDTKAASKLKLQTRLTRGGLLTAVVATFEESDDDVTYSPVMDPAAPSALVPLTITRTTNLTENFTYVIDVSGFNFVRVTLNGTAATAADTADLLASTVRGD